MKKMVFFLLLLTCHAVYSADSCTAPDDRTLQSIVRIAGDDGSNGSGIVIAKNRVLTAAHVLGQTETPYVGYGGNFKEGRLLLIDEENDLALLEAPTHELPPLPLGDAEMAINDAVWAVGYPRATALTITPGVLENDDGKTLHTSAEIDSGDSGGGLIGCRQNKYFLAGMLRGYGAIKRGNEYIKIANYSASVAARNIAEFIQISNMLAANLPPSLPARY